MATEITPKNVRGEIDNWINCYLYEQEEAKQKVWEFIDPWTEMMRVSELLKRKYYFLADFMKEKRINVVKEKEFDDKILDNSWKITFYEDDSNWTIYYVVKNNWEIIKVPYEKIDKTWDFYVYDNWFEWEQLCDYVDNETNYILEHHYDSYWNDMSPLYVIPYIK